MEPSNKPLANFVWRCMGQGLMRGALAGLLLPAGCWLIVLLYNLNIPYNFNFPSLETMKDSLFIFVYVPLFSFPLGGAVGLCLGFVFGVIAFSVLSSARTGRAVNFGSWISAMAISAAIISTWSVNSLLAVYSVTGDKPQAINPFSAPAAILAFVFVYASKKRIEHLYLESSND